MTAQELFDELFVELYEAKEAHYADYSNGVDVKLMRPYPESEGGLITEGYAELAHALTFRGLMLAKGTTIRIVFVSNMGDFGCTAKLDKKFGYEFRIMPDDTNLLNCRRTR